MALMADELTIEQAMEAVNNPKTRGATLYAIAAQYPQYPQLLEGIANHPRAYPQLLDWLWNMGDPDIQTIIAARRAEESSEDSTSGTGQAVPTTSMYFATAPADINLGTPSDAPQTAAYNPSVPYDDQPNKTPRNNHSLVVALIAGAIVLVLIAVITTWLLTSHNATVNTPPVTSIVTTTFYQPITTTSSTSQSEPVNTTTDSVTSSDDSSSTNAVDPEAEAKSLLDNQLAQDASSVAINLQDRWTTQLSAKKYGVPWEGHDWTYQDIWNEFTALRNQYPSAVLVQGSQYSSFGLGPEWYITASGVIFPDADAALSWCTSQGLTDGYCFAVRITNTHGSNTKHNR